MDKTLQKILQKVGDVQTGLLRYGSDEKKLSWHGRAATCDDSVNCIVTNENDISFLAKHVNFIQKDKHDYLYISCRVKEEVVKNSATIISMEVLKACWFTRRSRGSVTWLQEKYIYEAIPAKIDLAS